ncbi:hypothetical protein Tco_1499895 [Tanacetum coccineum]
MHLHHSMLSCSFSLLDVPEEISFRFERVHGRDFDALPSEEDTISFLRDLGHTGVINSLNDVVIDQMHQPWRTFAAIINILRNVATSLGYEESKAFLQDLILAVLQARCLPRLLQIIESSPSKRKGAVLEMKMRIIKKGKRLKTPAKKSASKPATGIVIRGASVENKSIEPRDKKKRVPDVTNDDSSESESESWGNDEDDSNNEQESSDESSKQENESEEQESDLKQDEESDDDDQEEEEFNQENESKDDKMKSYKEQGMDDTTDQFDDVMLIDAKNRKTTRPAIGIVQGEGNDTKMTEAQQGNENLEITQEQVVEDAHATSTPPRLLETTNPLSNLPDFSSVFRFNDRIIALEKEVSDLKFSHGKNQRASKRSATSDLPPGIKSPVQSEEQCVSMLRFSMPQDQAGNLGIMKYEQRMRCFRHDWYGLRTYTTQETTDPDWKGCKRLRKVSNSNVVDEILAASNLLDKSLLKGTRSNYAELEYDFEECYKALSEKLDWENPEGGDYPFDLSKPLPLITRGKHHSNSSSTMISSIEDMVPNIWSLVKVAYDKYALWGISHWREQCKSFYAYARGMQSRRDVYSTKCILAVTHVSVMRKHGYGYLEEIVVRRADNVLYRFKESDFSRLRINDIEDMLILVVQNRLTNLSGDDVADFAIALRMFTRSLVIQKRVEDLQLGVESYQKQINVTKPDTTRPDIRKRHPYTPYKDPQGFIYVDDIGRNRLMRTDELYKFSDDTLTRLLSSLEDITKNIDMTYLPKRRWSNLEKKRVHFMIKDINKLLKERRMMRSLEKFVGGRLYGTDLRLLQRISSYLKGRHGPSGDALTTLLSHQRFNTIAGNPVKKILFKLNLSDHRSILTDSKEYFKDGDGDKAMVWKSYHSVGRPIGDFLEHGYAVSSLMDTAYWSSE